MKDEDKSKQQLIEELVALRQQVAELQNKSISAKESNQLAKEALHESEERYRRLLEISFDAITIHQAGKLVAINDSGARLYGAASPEELIGTPILDFIHPEYLEAVQARMRQTRGEGKEVPLIEEKSLRLDKTSIDVEVAAVPISYQGQPAIQAVVRNISRRKRAEEALRESETKFRTLAETTTAAIFIYQGVQFRYVNPAAEAIASYTQAELLEMNLLDVIHPDFRQMTNDRRVARLRGEPVPSPYEVKILTKDGQERWLELSAGLIEFEGEPAVVGTAIKGTRLGGMVAPL